MRKALNDNPVAQIAVLGVLAAIVGFILLARGHGSSSSSSSTTPTTPAGSAATTPGTAPSGTAPAPGATSTVPSAGGTIPPGAVPTGKLVAGPGLPGAVANAYADNKAIVLLIVRHHGIDDGPVKASVESLRGRNDLAVFVTNAGHIARYARIAEGVDVNRVPALIVVRPKSLTNGPPAASVSYGFRSPDSVNQAVRDGLYKGPTNLPYYPR